MIFKKQLPLYFIFLLRIFFLGIGFFLFIRIIFLLVNFQQTESLGILLLLKSILHGWQFDSCICSYILALPFLILSVAGFFKGTPKIIFSVVNFLLIVFFFAAFLISLSDIPYFKQFNARISTSVFLWNNSPDFAFKMIFQDVGYWIYFFPFFFSCFAFIFLLRKIKKNIFSGEVSRMTFLFKFFIFLITGGLITLGMRGRIAEKSPIQTGTAFFSDNAFANQFVMNPVFSFASSIKEDMKPENKKLHLMSAIEAIALTKKFLNVSDSLEYPVARKIITEGPPKKMNVIVVIMESMSIYNMGKYGGSKNVSPNLDSLAKNNLFFENIFTQGIHTFNGIYSTLFSFPALMRQHPMQKIPAKRYGGMPATLKSFDYQNIFFITHDGQFDNAEGFLRANGFDEVYSQSDYPSEKILSTLGVPDDYLFEFSIPKLNGIALQGKNFFCGFMTGSHHHPFIFPEWAKINYKGKNDEERMVEYVDWSIGKFMRLASQQSWYKNTIFVFVGDHGMALNWVYDMPITYHHTPLIICAPELNLPPKNFDCLGTQMDIFPTVMGLMNFSYTNYTMGVDLLKEKRPFAFFSADDKIGCTDKEYFFIHRDNGIENLFRYKNLETKDLLPQYKSKADSMRAYAYSMLQTAQWIISNEKFGELKK